MSRNLLHINKLEAFKAWLDKKGIKHRKGLGDWQIMQVFHPDLNVWACIYERIEMPQHFTVDKRLDKLIARFIKESKVEL